MVTARCRHACSLTLSGGAPDNGLYEPLSDNPLASYVWSGCDALPSAYALTAAVKYCLLPNRMQSFLAMVGALS